MRIANEQIMNLLSQFEDSNKIDSNKIASIGGNSAPYLEQIAEWLRETQDIYIDIHTLCLGEAYKGYVKVAGKNQDWPDAYGDSWTETLEKSIVVALETLQKVKEMHAQHDKMLNKSLNKSRE